MEFRPSPFFVVVGVVGEVEISVTETPGGTFVNWLFEVLLTDGLSFICFVVVAAVVGNCGKARLSLESSIVSRRNGSRYVGIVVVVVVDGGVLLVISP